MLRKGDIVMTDKGLAIIQSVKKDGKTVKYAITHPDASDNHSISYVTSTEIRRTVKSADVFKKYKSDSKPEYLETQYIANSYQMGSLTSG